MDKEKRVKDNKEYIEGMVQGVYYTHKAWFTMEPTEIKDDIDRPITKEMEDGRYIYRDREGKEIETSSDDLEDIVFLVLEPLKYFFENRFFGHNFDKIEIWLADVPGSIACFISFLVTLFDCHLITPYRNVI